MGRPKKDVKKAVAEERVARVWYEATEKAKIQSGHRSLRDLVDALVQEKPSLEETRDSLRSVLVKDPSAQNKRVEYKKVKNPVLTLDAFYLLPSKLSNACIKAFPTSNSKYEAIAVTPVKDRAVDSPVEVVKIKGVGTFSREQI